MNEDDFEEKFNELAELRNDPIAFESKRKQILDDNLVKLSGGDPEKLSRCKAAQWRIDQELSKCKDPLARYNKMVEMFWTQFSLFQVQLNTLQGELESAGIDSAESKKVTAEILQFDNPHK